MLSFLTPGSIPLSLLVLACHQSHSVICLAFIEFAVFLHRRTVQYTPTHLPSFSIDRSTFSLSITRISWCLFRLLQFLLLVLFMQVLFPAFLMLPIRILRSDTKRDEKSNSVYFLPYFFSRCVMVTVRISFCKWIHTRYPFSLAT